MPPAQNKTNFKTYEASIRLLAAVLASNNGKIKLDYKELAELMGGGTTPSAVDHRLRPVKQLGKMQRACRDAKKDPGQLPVETGEIQRLFGESTASGIEWQFRDIKAISRAQQEALDEGKNPAEVQVGGASKAKGSAITPSTARASKATRAPASAGSKRKRGGKKAIMSEEGSDDQAAESDYEAKDVNSDSEFQATPAAKRRASRGGSTKAKAKVTPATTKKNGTAKATNGTGRKLFANGDADDANASAVDDDAMSSASKDDVIEVAAPAREVSARTRVKAEPEPEQESSEEMVMDGLVSSYTHNHGDDLSEGEI
ncbi:hypothetical protein F5Y05DRAFT_412881 [Hypoxylon sp. FL0543]|nr:hypothetical protein F5Y05DRAFT_412881 [Hypoxylon sp. FL0543]